MARAKKDSVEAYNAPFPVRLRGLMEQHRCTQADLAEVSGRTRQTVSQYTTGMSEPSYDVLVRIAHHFDVTTDYLLGLTDEPATKPAAVDDLGLSPQAVELLLEVKRRFGTPPSDGKAPSLFGRYADDMILGTLSRAETLSNYASMMLALRLPQTTLLDKGNGEDPLFSLVKFQYETEARGYALLSAEESFRYHAEKVGEALTGWLIDTYQDQGTWNRKEEQ